MTMRKSLFVALALCCLASVAADSGARRGGASSYFFEQIKHYLYEGDTALHMAAAAFQQPIVL